MDLQQIKYFLAIVDFGTFIAAAEQTHVSQPTLSAGIRKLEDSLDVKLFNRGSRQAHLTTAGEEFLSYARPAYNQLMSVKSKLSEEQEKIHIGVLNTIPMDHIAEIIRLYRISRPHVFVELIVSQHEELTQGLNTNKLDIVFTTKDIAKDNFTLLFNENLTLAVSSQHPFSSQNRVALSELTGQAFIERINCESWSDVHNILKKQNIKPHSVCRTENDDSVLSLVAANLGVSIMPVRNTPYDVNFIPIKDIKVTRNIGISYSSKTPDPNVHALHTTITRLFNIDKT